MVISHARVSADGMVAYSEEDLFPAPREVVWRLLTDHLNDAKIVDIHPLIQSQKTVGRTGNDVIVDRVIDVNRKLKKSRWKVTYDPPERARWEVVESEGPWTVGSFLELTYADEGKSTRIRAHGEVTVLNLPFFLSQPRVIRKAFNDIQTEDVWYLRRYRF
ncbi:MAG TPA: SRPBCC family protein [Thermoplasmata archaeon]|nr:SRPBCC family protein [Thermoplasmata archaeon]